MEIRLCDIKPAEEKEGNFVGDKEKQSMGNYIIFRMAVRAVTMFVGGFLSSEDIRLVYAISLAFPLALTAWVLFVFREIPV